MSNRRRPIGFAAVWLAVAALMSSCSDQSGGKPPPKASDAVPIPQESSIVSVPVEIDAAALTRAVEKAIPRMLWTINKHSKSCVPPKRVKVFGTKLKVTPAISCTIIGHVTRGAIRLEGEGRDIIAHVPISATVSARDVGGILKGETATASVAAQARITLDLAPDWTPRGTVHLHYSWTTPPGIDFLGQRVTFTEQADEKLQPAMRKLERELPRELAHVDLHAKVEQLWRKTFTSVELNRKNPPVWMRITPRRLLYDGYSLRNNELRLNLGLEALTETFVGPRPADPPATALPPPGKSGGNNQLRFFIPVVADYAQLEPVILRALVKRSKRPIEVPGLGPVMVRFEDVTGYGSPGGKIAVGITLAAKPASSTREETRGKIWLTARPVNAAGSAAVSFRDVVVTGDTNGVGGDLLIRLGQNPAIANMIGEALTQNFTRDLDKLLVKIKRAIEEKHEGNFVIRAHIAEMKTGIISAYGQGLYLPVRVTGEADIAYEQQQASAAR